MINSSDDFEATLKAAESGDLRAQATLSFEYYTGNVIECDFKQARYWLIKAAVDRSISDTIVNPENLKPFPDAAFDIFMTYESKGTLLDQQWAYQFLIVAAHDGVAQAAFELAIRCTRMHISKMYSGHKHAIRWFHKALEGGCKDAHRYLHIRYKDKDFPATVNWEKAFYHVSQIVEEGDYKYCMAIGRMYASGRGTAKNLGEAFKWLYIAASTDLSGDSSWDELMDVRKQMSESEYLSARQSALDWIKDNVASSNMRTAGGLTDPMTGEILHVDIQRRDFDHKRLLNLAYKRKDIPEVIWLEDMDDFFRNFEANYAKVSGYNCSHWAYCSAITRAAELSDGTEGRCFKDVIPKKLCKGIDFWPVEESYFEFLIDEMYENYEDELDQIQDDVHKLHPTMQSTIHDFLFLGPFSWLEQELELFKQIDPEGDLDEDNMMWLFAELVEYDMFLIPFENVVFIGPAHSYPKIHRLQII